MPEIFINEVRIDDSSIDPVGIESEQDLREYFEIRGPAGTSLSGYWYIVIGGRYGDDAGRINVLANLARTGSATSTASIASNGLYCIRPSGSTAPADITMLASEGFADERYSQTHLIVDGFNPLMGIGIGSDLDLDNDGILDTAPWVKVIDSVALVGPVSIPGLVYSDTRVGPWLDYANTTAVAATALPPQILRCRDNASWFVGVLAYRTSVPTVPSQSASSASAAVRDPRTHDTPTSPNPLADCACDATSTAAPEFCLSCLGDVNYDGLINGRLAPSSMACTGASADTDFCLARTVANDFSCRDVDRNGAVTPADLALIRVPVLAGTQAACPTGGTLPVACGTSSQVCTVASTAIPPARGCRFPACCEVVCASLPDCCDIEWDQDCASLANVSAQCFIRCKDCPDSGATSVCGRNPGDCFVIHDGPGCRSADCCERVCSLMPQCCEADTNWDAACVAMSLLLAEQAPVEDDCDPCLRASVLADCFNIHDAPGCNFQDCCRDVCADMPSCCTVTWDQACVDLAEDLCLFCDAPAAVTCYAGHSTPYCTDTNNGSGTSCCELICTTFEPNCCDVEWDAACARLAAEYCVQCGDQFAGVCGIAHINPKCSDAACCDVVCIADSYCCTITWDDHCVELAAGLCISCGSDWAGDCCTPHQSPYCRELRPGEGGACCVTVCGHDPGCCDIEWDSTCVVLAEIICGASCSCVESVQDCLIPHTEPGCSPQSCCLRVCEVDAFCCDAEWDTICAQEAGAFCAPSQPLCGISGSGSCRVVHLSVGCEDAECCGQVCANDPSCCDTGWDEDCVAEAALLCDRCGDPQAGACFGQHTGGGCEDVLCCMTVCLSDAFCCQVGWDAGCASLAFSLCGTPPAISCGDADCRPCWMDSPVPGCADLECCELVCAAVDPFCCEERWDAACAAESLYLCDEPPGANGVRGCFDEHPGTGCNDPQCSAAVCFVLPSCCDTEWDFPCVDLALDTCIQRDPCPADGPCFTVHNNDTGCNDPSCCNAVCTVDPACCAVGWDSDCVSVARTYCQANLTTDCPCWGKCLHAHSGAGCEDEACCTAVCQYDILCCTAAWDQDCATLARSVCCGSGRCGDSCNGSCLSEHLSPYCDDPYCCDSVCEIDPTCCSIAWDQLCVNHAFVRCNFAGFNGAGDCYVVHDSPGCNDLVISIGVCALRPECCSATWDQVCVDEVILQNGPIGCGIGEVGACNMVHARPYCSEAECCTAICAGDPFCCDTTWDSTCVQAVYTTKGCEAFDLTCGDTCAGPCCEDHDNPYCNNEECCQEVCAIDAICCDLRWDATCANEAALYCGDPGEECARLECGDTDAENCCSKHETPACNLLDCCQAVCLLDTFCCEHNWDSLCVLMAQGQCEICASTAACGTPLDGHDCLTSSKFPFCEAIAGVTTGTCCTDVCALLGYEYCCTAAWDDACVGAAVSICLFPSFPPANDDCGGATLVTWNDGQPLELREFSNFDATNSLLADGTLFPDPAGCDEDAASTTTPLRGDIWFKLVPPCTGSVTISTCQISGSNTVLAVYQRDPGTDASVPDCDALIPMGGVYCSDNAPYCNFGGAEVTVLTSADKPLWVRLGSPYQCGLTGCLIQGFVMFDLPCTP
ncbi:MAG: hypothetical protein EXS00_02260 [Phycisphaerales bacterium]|nr:hypothetical protein [Phycisphaerales bacterium]